MELSWPLFRLFDRPLSPPVVEPVPGVGRMGFAAPVLVPSGAPVPRPPEYAVLWRSWPAPSRILPTPESSMFEFRVEPRFRPPLLGWGRMGEVEVLPNAGAAPPT